MIDSEVDSSEVASAYFVFVVEGVIVDTLALLHGGGYCIFILYR